jgi:hypothetical protein
MADVKSGQLVLLGSDILAFEVNNILSLDKRTKVNTYLDLCTEHIDNSESVLNLGKRVQKECHIRARDALHVASAILGTARYFLSCDKQIIKVKASACYQRITKMDHRRHFTAMNPVLFVEKMKRGELK